MGRLSKAIFGRSKLPRRCIIYAGAYLPRRKDIVRRRFEKWSRIRGSWVKYAYAKSDGKEYLVAFNVYGCAVVLEVLHLLKDGGVNVVFLAGSMYAKDIPIGTLVIPSKVVDKTGMVLIDDPIRGVIKPDPASLSYVKSALEASEIPYIEAKIASVPCVLHDIGHVKEFVEKSEDIMGVEMEVSTFYHFSKRLGLVGYALLYVSDNQRYDVISRAEAVREARREALRKTTSIALKVLKAQ